MMYFCFRYLEGQPQPIPAQTYQLVRMAIALAGGFVAAGLGGTIEVTGTGPTLAVKAAGPIAVVVFFYWADPQRLLRDRAVGRPVLTTIDTGQWESMPIGDAWLD